MTTEKKETKKLKNVPILNHLNFFFEYVNHIHKNFNKHEKNLVQKV